MAVNLLIGLREALEASIVVSILVAYLVRSGHRDKMPAVAAGVLAAIAVSLAVGAVLVFTSRAMTFEQQELFGGTLSVVAVGFVTAMVLWMRTAARTMRGSLDGRMQSAVRLGPAAVALTAFLAVGREGLETSLFLIAAARATGTGWSPAVGATLGLLAGVALGYLLYRGAVRLDLRRFFTWTGVGLVVVAAGVLAYGVHDLQEARFLPGLGSLAFDVSEQVPPASWYGVLLKGTLNFSPATTWLEAVAWVSYVVVMLTLFLRPHPARSTPRHSPAPSQQPAV